MSGRLIPGRAGGRPSAGGVLGGVRAYRLVSAPRPPEDPQVRDPAPAQLFAAVTSMHATFQSLTTSGADVVDVIDGPDDPAGLDEFAGSDEFGAGVPGARSPLFFAAWLRLPEKPTKPAEPTVRTAQAARSGQERFVFLLGGRPFLPGAAPGPARVDGTRGLLFPPGASGVEATGGEVDRLLAEFPVWLPCLGAPDALWSLSDEEVWQHRRGSFDEHAAHLAHPFAWMVLAQPRPADLVQADKDRLEIGIPMLREAAQGSRWAELERAEARYRELARYGGAGMWDVRVLVGSDTAAGAGAAASLLCGAAELGGLPYTLVPSGRPGSLAEAAAEPPGHDRPPYAAQGGWQPGPPDPFDLADIFVPTAPFAASSELLAALARPPARELPGVRLLTPHRFDVTRDRTDDDGFPIGTVLDPAYADAGTFVVTRPTLNRHAFLCGATGSGKSQTARTLLTELSAPERPGDRVPWLVIEPAKAEYARMAGRIRADDTVTVLRPGVPDDPPGCLNPLEPEPGYPLQSHADLVRELFLAAFNADNPVPQILSIALAEVYANTGWDMVTGEPRPGRRPKLFVDEVPRDVRARYPTLGELRVVAQRVVDDIGYGREVRDNVRGLVDVRLRGLREGTPGRFFEGGHPLDVGALLRGNVVLELDRVTSDQDKAFLMGVVLIRIVEYLRTNPPSPGDDRLRHVLVIEEAHRLLRRDADGPAGNAVELFAGLLAEIRAYGEGVVVVEQIPSKIIPDVLKNTALKVMHRLPAADDRASVGATMNLREEQSEHVVALPPGQAAVALDGMDRPLLVRMGHGERSESTERASHLPPLRAARSDLCPPDCRTAPCTLRAMNEARHDSTSPLLVLWVEAVVAATVAGVHPVDPAPALSDWLLRLPPRQRDCALAHAVERAVDARRPLLRRWLDPADLADHILADLTARLGLRPPPTEDHRRFQAGVYRWHDVRGHLDAAVAQAEPGSPGGPHPHTERWARRGLILDGADVVEQMRVFREHPANATGSHRVAVGDPDASGLTAAQVEVAGATGRLYLRRAFARACVGKLDPIVRLFEKPPAGRGRKGPQAEAET
ncbi:DNA helicase HerA, contains HAS-barrel and ATPase domains [Parafrankia irregularis]|uniref:DNA helicase HerA, contains HAS-barrel and ATPase domains n=2 Tax=Frankiaceae TaxID=74712 RepID=A0A0S4QR91_9ACTN|nr:DNA helicase HerA, contains HAS-barrel and ATPase domains [Parafrankia irregularis]